MQGLKRWMSRHRLLAKILISSFVVICYSFLLLLDVTPWLVLAIDLFLVFFFCIWVDVCISGLVNDAIQVMHNQCDPYPLLEETTRQMSLGFKGTMEQTLRINHAYALREAGQYQQALELLNSINIDRYGGTLPAAKFVYYNNLMDILTILGRYDEAEIWYQKSVQIYQDLPQNKIKQQLTEAIESAAAHAWFRRGEFAKARECLDAASPKSLCQKVSHALLYARCCVAQGNPKDALEPLGFVIQYGNRLGAVREAQVLLQQIRTPELGD